jgi:pilus assembly protein Flp/PilA
MTTIVEFFRSLDLKSNLRREDGQALVEYALILSLVSIAAIVTLGLVGTQVDTVLGDVLDALGG